MTKTFSCYSQSPSWQGHYVQYTSFEDIEFGYCLSYPYLQISQLFTNQIFHCYIRCSVIKHKKIWFQFVTMSKITSAKKMISFVYVVFAIYFKNHFISWKSCIQLLRYSISYILNYSINFEIYDAMWSGSTQVWVQFWRGFINLK